MYCQNCGAQLPDSAKFCDRCGAKIGVQGSGPSTSEYDMASIMVNKKSEALALILSLIIPGLGQIYIGQMSKGIMLVVAAIIIGVISAFLLFPIVIYLVLWIYGMYDAFKGAKEYNSYLLEHKGQPPW